MKKYSRLLTALLYLAVFSFCCLLYSFFYTTQEAVSNNHTRKNVDRSKPLILFYTPIFGQKASQNVYVSSLLKTCSFPCSVSDNPQHYPLSDVAIFHSLDMKMNDFIHKYRNLNRLNVFFTLETFPHEKIRRKRFPKDFFNVTATYLRKSELWMPYEKFQEILPPEKNDTTLVWSNQEVDDAISQKTNLATTFVSHCITHSFREKLIEDMKRYTNISTFGACYNSTKFNASQELDKHFFYLAFENSICKDYVTEKFWRIKELIVPVVMKRSILRGISEDDYFIAADDFNSTQALVDRLIYLSKNLTEYKKYFEWTKKYKKVGAADQTELCRICEMAVKKEKHYIPDIYQWWEEESQCQFNYLNFTLKYLKSNNLTILV